MKRLLTLLLALALCLGLSAPALAAEFSDVPPTYVFHQAISDCVEKGILSGYDDGTFRPPSASHGPNSASCWPGPSTPGRTRPTPG